MSSPAARLSGSARRRRSSRVNESFRAWNDSWRASPWNEERQLNQPPMMSGVAGTDGGGAGLVWEVHDRTRGESMRYVSLALGITLGTQRAAAQRPYDLPIRNAPVRTIAEFPGVEIGSVRPSGMPNRLYYAVGDKLYVFDV